MSSQGHTKNYFMDDVDTENDDRRTENEREREREREKGAKGLKGRSFAALGCTQPLSSSCNFFFLNSEPVQIHHGV